MNENELLGLRPHKCVVCDKEFECRSEYVYKLRKPGHCNPTEYCCSYKCYRVKEKEYLGKKRIRWSA